MSIIKWVVGTWLGLSCFAEFAAGFLFFQLKSEYIYLFLAFCFGSYLAITIYCWFSGDKEVKKVARKNGIIYGILQTRNTIMGNIPELSLIPVLMILLIILDMQE